MGARVSWLGEKFSYGCLCGGQVPGDRFAALGLTGAKKLPANTRAEADSPAQLYPALFINAKEG
jgi:hypothetical protein